MSETTHTHPERFLGLDIGGTKTAVLLGDDQGEIYCRVEMPTPAQEPFEPALSKIAAAAEDLLVECKASGIGTPAAISVSVGGPLDIERGILYAPPHLAAWGEAPLKQRLESIFDLPVFVEHDGNAGALAEHSFGAGRGTRNMIFLTMGTGLGAGLILNGRLYRGSTDTAGEVGHIRIADDGPLHYQKAGGWEGYCSAAGMVSLALLRQPGRWPDDLTARALITAALKGEPDALAVVREAGHWFGRGLAVLVDLLNPERIVVGTLGVVLGDILLAPARAVVQEEALPRAAAACQIVPAALGGRLGDVASLMAGIIARAGKTA